MKKFTAIAIFTLGFLVAGNAVAQHKQVRANVPFSFTVGNKILPPGAYSITAVSEGGIEIRNLDRHLSVLAMAPNTADGSKKENVLVFEKHAGEYSLRDVICETAAMNRSLVVKHWKKGSLMEEAENQGTSSLVYVAIGE